jgi:hypothetical protein
MKEENERKEIDERSDANSENAKNESITLKALRSQNESMNAIISND